jgi:hypothetical protein
VGPIRDDGWAAERPNSAPQQNGAKGHEPTLPNALLKFRNGPMDNRP